MQDFLSENQTIAGGVRLEDHAERVDGFLISDALHGIEYRIPDTPTCHVVRHDWDRWFETFDMIARQLGYARKETPTADPPRGARTGVTAAAAVAAVLAAFGLLA